MAWAKVILFFLFYGGGVCQFFDCHDDITFDPDEGPLSQLQFTWLGALQYIHVKNGTPHYFRVPRVILISRQFALSTAVDAAQIPDGYALGNVIFGDYERDEAECKVTIQDLAAGSQCDPAVLLMPIADVLLHPEYKHFGAKDSIALLKLITPVKSKYMLPACLPFKNFLIEKSGKQIKDKIYHVDFSSDVPRDFIEEEKEVLRISLLPRELCYLYDRPDNVTSMPKDRIACTTGCGFHSGAPCVIHEHTGHWSIVSLAQGGSPCPDPLRTRRPPPPPRHILLYPYVPWITAAITGKAVGAFAKDDPFGFIMPRTSLYDLIGHAWVGHWWMGGLRCYDRGESADDIFRFYHEIFVIKPETHTFLTYYLEVNAAHDTMTICVKVGMPYQLGMPKVWQLDTPETKVRVPVVSFYHTYQIQVEAWAYNSTESSTSTESSSDYTDEETN
ncbi:prostasin-like [Epargyreus clarus]|uniref:prostasin-like n=1 Tax=Epargyreus clarus TaxID=520877 RepID=UPI003C2AB42F